MNKKALLGFLAGCMTLSLATAVGCVPSKTPQDSTESSSSSEMQTNLWTLETVYARAQELGYDGSLALSLHLSRFAILKSSSHTFFLFLSCL